MKKRVAILICVIGILILGLLAVSILNIGCLNRATSDFLRYFNSFVTPIGIIAGLFIGYPLLKKKLLENYVSKQFEIMHEANRILRKGCIDLLNKYPSKGGCNKLDIEYVHEAIRDVESLLSETFDANPDATKYLKLTATALIEFEKLYPKEGSHNYYKETINNLLYSHVKHVYNCAKSVGVNLDATTKNRRRLHRGLDKFVFDNSYVDVDSVDYSLDNYHASQLLVSFFWNSFAAIDQNNPLLYLACYKAAPSPCPIARILFISSIYVPPVLKKKEAFQVLQIDVGHGKLNLVGFQKMVSAKKEERRSYYVCYYANIEHFNYVDGTIKDKSAMDNFDDDYLMQDGLSSKRITKFEVLPHEMIKIEIDTVDLQKKFEQSKVRLRRKMKKEKMNKDR